MSENAFDA